MFGQGQGAGQAAFGFGTGPQQPAGGFGASSGGFGAPSGGGFGFGSAPGGVKWGAAAKTKVCRATLASWTWPVRMKPCSRPNRGIQAADGQAAAASGGFGTPGTILLPP